MALGGSQSNARPPGGQWDRWFFIMHQTGTSYFDFHFYDPTMGREYHFVDYFNYYVDWYAISRWYEESGRLRKNFEDDVYAYQLPIGNIEHVEYYDNPRVFSNYISTYEKVSDFIYKSASFEDGFIAVPIDTNGDGRFEQLSVSGQVNVIENGSYCIQGSLQGSEDFITSRSSMYDTTTLWHYITESSGLVDIQLFFSGHDIRSSQLDEAYTVNLIMNDVNGIVVDELVFETPVYTASQFGETSADLVSINDSLLDIDGDLIYDALRVETTVNVYQPGNYYLDAILLTPDGTIAGSADPNSVLSKGLQVVTLDFDGRELSTIQDPNNLRLEITINDSEGEQQDHGTFTTNIYDPTNFIKKDVSITGPYSDILYDADSDGLIDTLRVEVGVEVTDPNNYQATAWLQDSNGIDITTSRSNINLGVGKQNITFDFEGHKIHEHGVDGPYSIIYLLVENSEGVVDSKREIYFTKSYDFTDFDLTSSGFQEGFETGDFNKFDWVSFGDAEWSVTSDEYKSGTYSARAGSIYDNGSTTLKLTLDCTSGDISFNYKISSEQH